MNVEQLKDDLILDEGIRLKPYQDTVGKTTIGVGRNLEDNGIRDTEAKFMLMNDINMVIGELDANIPWWAEMPEPCQRALANMLFNLGWPRLSRFQKMLAALEAGRYSDAAEEALDSRWADQVGERARRIAKLYRRGDEI